MANLEIATEIKRQLYVTGTTKVRSWGTRNFAGGENYLTFKVSGHLFKGWVKITLNGMDYYDIQFIGQKGVVKHEIKDVDCFSMTDMIDEYVERIPAYKR